MHLISKQEGKTASGIYWRKATADESNPPLVLVMGYAGSCRIWPVELIDELACDYTVITYDNRGTGLSIVPSDPTEYTIELMASDLRSVLTELGLQQAHLLGYSMGGCIAITFAHLYPDTVKTLILISSTAGGAMFVKPDPEISSALANPQGQTLWDIYMNTFRLMYSAEQLQRCEPVLRRIYDQSKDLPTSLTGMRGHSNAFRQFDASRCVSTLSAHTLILSGQDDRLMPLQNSINLKNAIPRAELVVIPECEHAPHIQERALVTGAIRKHCK